jgi:hypothetical protein
LVVVFLERVAAHVDARAVSRPRRGVRRSRAAMAKTGPHALDRGVCAFFVRWR